MNLFKQLLAFALVCIYTNTSLAQAIKFEPTFTVFESYTYTKNYSVLNAGLFNLANSQFNFGLEVSQKIHFNNNYFFKFGLRYQHFKKDVNAENQVPELYNYPYPFYWEYNYSAFTMPIHFGKEYYHNNLKRGDYYLGLSVGILTTSSVTGGITRPQSRESSFLDLVQYSVTEEFNHNPNFFFPNIEAGVNYFPLKNFRKLSIGLNASIQLNKAGDTKHIARVEVPTKGYDFHYDFSNKNRMMNILVCAGYTF